MAQIKAVFVLASDGTRLMPTYNVKKVRKLLRSGKAKIASYRPYFTIQLTYSPEFEDPGKREISFDTGSEHIGVSAKSEKHEYLSEQRDNLENEKAMHEAQAKKRKARRNRMRYRKPRFDNRKRDKGWLAPSLRHKKDNHVYLATELLKVFPATDVWLEMGSFDIQALAAIEAGKPLPEGVDYQRGPKFEQDTLRDAVFYRDNYTCLVCGKSAIKDGVGLREHHIGFWYGDHSDRMENLAAVCSGCHIPKNHKEGGSLWGLKPELKPLKDAAFMNSVRWILYNEIREISENYGAKVHMTYGTVTKRERKDRNLAKSHAVDAYCIGRLHPKHRAHTFFYKKKRRNNRRLQKFYDAKYIDIRDGKEKKAAELGCNRDNRKHPRNWDKNERIFRGPKTSKGHISIKRQNYEIRSGDPLLYTWEEDIDGTTVQKSKRIISAGTQHYGEYVTYKDSRTVPMTEVIHAKDRAGNDIPIEPGNRCMHIGGKKKKKPKSHKVYAVDSGNGTVTLNWVYSVRTAQVRCLKFTCGWAEYIPDELYIYTCNSKKGNTGQ